MTHRLVAIVQLAVGRSLAGGPLSRLCCVGDIRGAEYENPNNTHV